MYTTAPLHFSLPPRLDRTETSSLNPPSREREMSLNPLRRRGLSNVSLSQAAAHRSRGHTLRIIRRDSPIFGRRTIGRVTLLSKRHLIVSASDSRRKRRGNTKNISKFAQFALLSSLVPSSPPVPRRRASRS